MKVVLCFWSMVCMCDRLACAFDRLSVIILIILLHYHFIIIITKHIFSCRNSYCKIRLRVVSSDIV